MLTVRKKSLRLAHGRIGLIADTHGLLRPQAIAALKDSELIIHAGDIGSAQILAELATIAPLAAVRGLGERGVSFERYAWFPQDELGIWTSDSGARVAWFKDPQGHILSLTQPGGGGC